LRDPGRPRCSLTLAPIGRSAARAGLSRQMLSMWRRPARCLRTALCRNISCGSSGSAGCWVAGSHDQRQTLTRMRCAERPSRFLARKKIVQERTFSGYRRRPARTDSGRDADPASKWPVFTQEAPRPMDVLSLRADERARFFAGLSAVSPPGIRAPVVGLGGACADQLGTPRHDQWGRHSKSRNRFPETQFRAT